MATQVNQERYLAPKEQPIFRLECAKAFAALTDKEKLYAHYISQASWRGSIATLEQTSPESPVLFEIFQSLFKDNTVSDLGDAAQQNGVSKEHYNDFLQFVSVFYGNMGNYQSFGDTKIVPRLPEDQFRKILASSKGNKDGLLAKFDKIKDITYSMDPSVLSLGMDGEGISTYYFGGVTSADVDRVQKYMQQENISPYNTRLEKLGANSYRILIASANKLESKKAHFEDFDVEIAYGDHQSSMQAVVDNLKAAIPYAANVNQENMLRKYVDHFSNGSIDDHKDAQRHWIKDKGPVVESNIGFIESYRDPKGERGEFEGFVAVVNKEMSAKFANLVKSAQPFISQLPWPTQYEKDTFLSPDFTSLEVLSFAGSGVPAGINIPNYDDIRQSEGFKNVSLGNVLSAKSNEPADFILPEDSDLFNLKESHSFEVQVGIHELLGHGTGKLFQEISGGKFNFEKSTVNPLTGQPVTTWYKPGETWDSKFGSHASTMEECRAESVGIFLSTEMKLLEIFGYQGKEAEDVYYINWLIMVRAGIRALEFYTPETKKWGQAHMQGRYAILRVLEEAGNGLVGFKITEDNVMVVLDRSKILSIGKKAIGDFLVKLQTYKSTGDAETGTKWYTELTSVPENYLKIREIILKRKKPRRILVQPHTVLKGDQVEFVDFDATPEGIIRSFQAHFA